MKVILIGIRQIVFEGNPILNKSCRAIQEFNTKLHENMDDLIETMYLVKAIGLAGPHIGLLKRIISIDVGDGFMEIVNPEIVDQFGTQREWEGSVSCPGEQFITVRPLFVKVHGQDRNGNNIEINAKGLKARTICHEIDQINGIFFKTRAVSRLD